MRDRRRRLRVREVVDDDAPRALVLDPVADDGVVAAAGDLDAAAHGSRPGDAGPGNVRIVVVVHVIAFDDGARVGAGRAGSAVGTGTVLRRWSVVVVQGVGNDPRLVVVPFGVADHEVTAAV